MQDYPSEKLEKLKLVVPTLKFLVIGHKSHGKDYLVNLMIKYLEIKFASTTVVMCEEFIFDVLKDELEYKTPAECHADRDNHRPIWFQLTKLFCYHDKTALIRKVLSDNVGYNGLRNVDELNAAKELGLFDLTIWVDACIRMPLEDSRSMTVTANDAEYFFDNNVKTIEAAHYQLELLFDYIYDNYCL